MAAADKKYGYDYLSPQDVARTMHVTPRTVRNMFHRGDLEGAWFGSQIRILKSSLDLYLETHKTGIGKSDAGDQLL